MAPGFEVRGSTQTVPSSLSEVSASILSAIQKYSKLAWPILKAQCSLRGLDPAALQRSDLQALAPALAEATARFTNPASGQRLLHDLMEQEHPHVEAPRWANAPSGLEPESVSARAFALIRETTALAWTILDAQASRMGFDASRLTAAQLIELVPAIEAALARFSSPTRAAGVAAKLRSIADPAASASASKTD